MADLLTATLPDSWQGRRIDPDFRHMVRLSNAYAHGRLDGEHPEEALAIMERFYHKPVPPEQLPDAYGCMVDFYRAGEQAAAGASDQPDSTPASPPAFDYQCDAGYIVALFAALPEETLMAKIMSWRTMDLSEYEGSMRAHYADLQERFALPAELRGGAARVVSVEEHDAAFLARFRH
ncbi:MAG: hypothetical protein KH145_01930 [Faecalibacterium prausnitzii]|nr:hypothetical protein [Faecalibacterium prausnitzii]